MRSLQDGVFRLVRFLTCRLKAPKVGVSRDRKRKKERQRNTESLWKALYDLA